MYFPANPICLIGDVIYVDDSQNFDQSDDDVLQTETNLAEKSAVDLWDQVRYHQLEKVSSQYKSPMTLKKKVHKFWEKGIGLYLFFMLHFNS